MTNNFQLSAKTIAQIYKARWDIELFFKWIKQNLKIKTFLGTSPNAVMIQIWTALIYYLLLAYIKYQTRYQYTLLESRGSGLELSG
jgi:IS4 transposase